jgi:hypothetical protein
MSKLTTDLSKPLTTTENNEDETSLGSTMVEPNIEHELPKDKRQACRDILVEIKNFGVNQRQILYLIQLLAMELENGEAMRAITKAVGTHRKDIPVGNKLITPDKKTIIL